MNFNDLLDAYAHVSPPEKQEAIVAYLEEMLSSDACPFCGAKP